FEPAPDLPAVMADRVQLQQVILNLMLNGIEATSGSDESNRTLWVRTHHSGMEEVRVSISDSGAGIAPRDLDRIFDAFVTTKTGAFGMGISISRSIVEALCGRLWVESEPGRGATFSFTLPVSNVRSSSS